jgi:uncharacterized protein DUF402
MRPGEIVEFRSVWDGVPRWRFPVTVVADDGDLLVTYLAPGAQGEWIPRGADALERWLDPGADAEPHTWSTHHVLWLVRRGEAHALGLFWDEQWEFQCWYVNLQLPVEVHDGCVDTCDQALDVVVEPDGTWSWKDEADLEKLVALGAFSDEEARAIRAEGERVIAAKPWPTGWEDWRP